MRLSQFEEWIKTTELATTESEREYVQKSIEENDRLEEEKRLRKEHQEALEQPSRNRLRQLLTVMTVAAVISVGLMVVAITQSGMPQMHKSKLSHRRIMQEHRRPMLN